MKTMFSIALVSVLLVASTSAQAANNVANLQKFQGKVLVNHGQGFARVSLNTGLNVGDQVLVGDDASAVITFESCTVNIAKSTVFKVTKTAPCAKGQKIAQVGEMFIVPAATEVFAGDKTPLIVFSTWAAAGAGLMFFASRNCNGVSAC